MARGDTLITTQGSGPLNRFGTVTLDGSGNGQTELVIPAGQQWAVARATTSCTGTNNPMPVFKLYDGFPSPGNLIDGTYTGGFDASDFPNPLILTSGMSVFGVWTNGVPGSLATLRLVGIQQSA